MTHLNLGAGNTVIEGYTPIDRMFGSEVYPLNVDDESVDTIRASHCLEHFSHTETRQVVAHWISKLKPGGCLKIAVPNFEWIAKEYLKGTPINSQGYTMGGHTDANDRHGAIFDREALFELMVNLGLERIGFWQSEIQDCAALPVSLNLMGFKPTLADRQVVNTVSVLSAPRYGPMSHQSCAHDAFGALRIPHKIGQGAYWHEVLCEAIEMQLEDHAEIEYVITNDYDTIFSPMDVLELYRLMRACPEADAIIPVQSMRGSDTALFGLTDADGKPRTKVYRAEFQRNLTKIATGHFGLSIFRASTLRKSKRPWMLGAVNEQGRWSDGRIDPDIDFWRRWNEQGFSTFLANRVVVGHSCEAVMWPGQDYKPIFQNYKDYLKDGIPKECAR